MNRWIYWRNIGFCASCSLYRLLNYIGCTPEELSPLLYINHSVTKNCSQYVIIRHKKLVINKRIIKNSNIFFKGAISHWESRRQNPINSKTAPFTFKTSERWGHAKHVFLHCLQSICRQKPTTPTKIIAFAREKGHTLLRLCCVF